MKIIFKKLLTASAVFLAVNGYAAVPSIQNFSATSVVNGQPVVFTIHVADADGDLDYLDLSVSGPGTFGWQHLVRLEINGTSDTSSFSWPTYFTGTYTVKATAFDLGSSVSVLRSFEVYPSSYTVSARTLQPGANQMVSSYGVLVTEESSASVPVIDIMPGANFILWSGGRVTLKPGIRVRAGASFWGAVDHNMDGYSDMEESIDSDGDGLFDSWEIDHGFNPYNPNDPTSASYRQDLILSGQDTDGDSLNDLFERLIGLNASTSNQGSGTQLKLVYPLNLERVVSKGTLEIL
jgi:hypothetical protein